MKLTTKQLKGNSRFKKIWKYRWFYVMIIPVIILSLMFFYYPMLGIRFAFFEYTPFKGPNFKGFANFEELFSNHQFWIAFKNTIIISTTKLVLTTFVSVVVSLLLNEVANLAAKKFFQTLIYLPHFLSWVVVASIFSIILSPQHGFMNEVLIQIGIIDKPIYFMAESGWWRKVYYVVNIWKETGWGTIIFLATLTGIDPQLYEAAAIDGANRWAKMRFITLPSLSQTIIIVLILNLAKIMNLFESVFVLYSPKVYDVADVLQTYIYRQTLTTPLPNFGYTTAVGLFSSVIGCFMVLLCNHTSKRVRGRGIL
ncbi:ABC transporter permease subunit [Anaerocolumna sp. AGMB13020]|uniref:ABC transporter permease n=1 Tax=Anaerocolumna sp. AGMB13020 TaxID=3081750 RepID=UPI002953FDB4|nr:ABC transporter permease subunit [Anaerocolumna sp. AGMB13020]WOO37116.1 ABC transporter permease subunit [Anaerocolumna sp. AGMB13020]